MKARQFTLRLLMLVVTVVASFFAGYRLGFSDGREVRFDGLEQWITETIHVYNPWEDGVAWSDSYFEPPDSLSAADSVLKLTELGEPDENLRTMNGIEVVGSSLTDDHVKAICQLTDEFKPMNPSGFLVRGIEQTGKNTAVHVWQERHYQAYQQLELHDGQWRLVETGAGFINSASPGAMETLPSD